MLTYDVPASVATSEQDPIWDTADFDENETVVVVGKYERPTWFFTSPGTYEFQTHVNGHPNPDKNRADGHDPVSSETSVTGDVREYILHVGLMANLSVGVTATPESPVPYEGTTPKPGTYTDDQVTITVTARNAGPDKGENTKVDVPLPDGLTHVSATTATGTYDSATSVWSVGDLEKDGSATLTITATANVGTRGYEQTITANIYATEDIDSLDVVELDPDSSNNTDSATVTPLAIPNTPTMFKVMRSVHENAHDGTILGDPIPWYEPDTADVLSLSLTGHGAHHFAVTEVDGGAQIAVRGGSVIDYESDQSFHLVLAASDGKDDKGNPDTAIDDRIGVWVEVIDDPWDTARLTLSASHQHPSGGVAVLWTAHLHNLPAGHGPVSYSWSYRTRTALGTFGDWTHEEATASNTFGRSESAGTTIEVRVQATVDETTADDSPQRQLGTFTSEVTWQQENN